MAAAANIASSGVNRLGCGPNGTSTPTFQRTPDCLIRAVSPYQGIQTMLFGTQFQSFFDSIVEIIIGLIRAQYSELFALIELFQTLVGGGAV